MRKPLSFFPASLRPVSGCRRLPSLLSFLLGLGLSTAVNLSVVRPADADTEFSTQHGDFFHLLLPSHEDIHLRYLYEADHGEDGGPGKFDLNSFSAAGELPIPLERDTYLRFGGGYSARWYDFKDVPGAATSTDSDTLHAAELSGGAGIFLNDDLLLSGKGTFGAYSDFDGGLDTDDFRLSGEGELVYRINPGAQLLAGLRWSEDFDDTPIFPLLGIRLLSEDGKLHISLTAPVDLRVGYNINPDIEFYADASLQGNEYRMSAGERHDFQVHVQDRRAGLGFRWWLGDTVSLGAEAGLSWTSELKFKTEDAGQFGGDLDPAGYVSADIGIAL
jgi:hypothetical protein